MNIYEKGLSLIESAMALVVSAAVTAGVMLYYQTASDSNKTQSAMAEIMNIAAFINGLYTGQTSYKGLSDSILLNTSAISDNYKDRDKINNPFGGSVTIGTYDSNAGYYIKLTEINRYACINLATLNMGSSAAGYGVNVLDSDIARINDFTLSVGSNGTKKIPFTPSESNDQCKNERDNNVVFFLK
ncbi:pilus assembly protein [Escherichia coli]|nr:pilus assembly protein [Escherichia coli]